MSILTVPDLNDRIDIDYRQYCAEKGLAPTAMPSVRKLKGQDAEGFNWAGGLPDDATKEAAFKAILQARARGHQLV